MQATVETAYQGWVIGIVLLVSLLSIIALTRVGFNFILACITTRRRPDQSCLYYLSCFTLKKHRHVTIPSSISYLPV
ncbi:hypothetical protein ABVN80_03480 [Acinetobacter baumannii]